MQKNEEKIFGFKRNVFFLGLVSFFNDLSAEMVQSVMPVFLTSILGAPVYVVGIIEGVADGLASFLKLFSGWFSDKINRRKLPAILGYAISVTTRIFLVVAVTFQQVFALRLIDRFGKGLRDAPRDALMVESADGGDLGKSFGLQRSMDAMGSTLGPLVAFFALPFFGNDYRILFFTSFVLGLLAIFSFFFIKDIRMEKLDGKKLSEYFSWEDLRENKKFILTLATLFVFGLGALPIALVTLKASEIGVGNMANVPLMYFVYSFSFVIAAIPLGKLADKIGARIVIAGGFLMAILAYLGLIQADGMFLMVISFIFLGFYAAATDGLQRVLIAQSIGPKFIATGQGFWGMTNGFANLGAGIIGGLLWTFAGSSASLLYAATISVIGFVLFFFTID